MPASSGRCPFREAIAIKRERLRYRGRKREAGDRAGPAFSMGKSGDRLNSPTRSQPSLEKLFSAKLVSRCQNAGYQHNSERQHQCED